ncbi:hypothetical protein FE257_000944 [Aspergillus nanangensis]|uniref:ATP-grasp domain-containing protein n=1 Tax=Aspergillus nanangensis TaxID=2582783 RepID=A0AAD4GPV6_ASPNN|nr:hypothetical protein FE257_000944 [Aspergillus nanangensis]
MRNNRPPSLNVAFVFDPKTDYLDQGYSITECGDLADDITINGISSALKELGHNVVQVPGIKTLVDHLAADTQKEWDIVFNFGEGVTGSARESQIPALLEAYDVPFTFSDAATLALCIDKGKTKMALDHYQIPTSPFFIVPQLGAPVDYSTLQEKLPYPLFAKPVAASTSNGITASNKITRKEKFRDVIEGLRAQFPAQQILVEPFLAGREFTVGILGTGENSRVLGVSEVTGYNPEGQEDGEPIDFATIFSKSGGVPGKYMEHIRVDVEDLLVKQVSQVALQAYKAVDCRDAGRVDIRLGSGAVGSTPYVIEART